MFWMFVVFLKTCTRGNIATQGDVVGWRDIRVVDVHFRKHCHQRWHLRLDL